MRTIALEEHFASPAFLDGPHRYFKERAERAGGRLAAVLAQLADVGDGRVAAMDAAGIDVQALSLTAPGVEQLDASEAKRIRARLECVSRAGDPAPSGAVFRARGAADRRSAGRGRGARARARRRWLQGRRHQRPSSRTLSRRPFLLADSRARGSAEASDLSPSDAIASSGHRRVVRRTHANSQRDDGGPGWGWHIETALHVLRMILGGVFDAHPELQIVVGHMGETLPFMLQRVDVMAPAMTKLKKPISAYLRENVHYTFAGFNFLPTFLDLLLQVGVDRIMFSTDHPYQSMAEGRAFLDRLPVSAADRERIAHGNAERLFGN